MLLRAWCCYTLFKLCLYFSFGFSMISGKIMYYFCLLCSVSLSRSLLSSVGSVSSFATEL